MLGKNILEKRWKFMPENEKIKLEV